MPGSGTRSVRLRFASETTGIARDVAIPLVHDDDGEMHSAYDAERPSVYLIRPDGYLAFRADWADRHVLLEFLETYLIRSAGDARSSSTARAAR